MLIQRNHIKQILIFCSIFFIILFCTSSKIFAELIDWIEVSRDNNEILSIDPNSIKYNKKGNLFVLTKYSVISSEDKGILNTDSFLMAIDCENRLFSKLPINIEIPKVKTWESPTNNKLIKQTILKSCSS